VFEVRDADARRLHREGRGVILDEAEAKAVDKQATAAARETEKAAKAKPLANPRLQGSADGPKQVSGRAKQGIPDDFPAAELLRENGFETIEDLKAPGIEDKLREIPGVGKGTVNKIGIALGEY
jgi:hypothetical protein